jgi:hypothetical protein
LRAAAEHQEAVPGDENAFTSTFPVDLVRHRK